MVVKTLTKISFLSIKKTINRFISILLIVLLGVGFFAGIKATSPDMRNTANELFDNTNLYDIFVTSDWGLTDDDISYLKDSGYDVEGSYSFDAIVKIDNEYAVKVLSYNEDSNMNKLILVDGELPTNDNECVLDYGFHTKDYKIGDKLTIESEDNYLKNNELTIVGFVRSPLYISRERGSTNLLSGTLSFYLYTNVNNFDIDYYTESYIDIVDNVDKFSDKYEDTIDNSVTDLEGIANYLQERRFNEEKTEAQNTLNEKIEEYNNEKLKAEQDINDAENKINSASRKIKSSENELNSAKSELETKKNEANNNITTIKNNISSYQSNLNEINGNISSVKLNIEYYENLISSGINVEENTIILNQLNSTLNELNTNKNNIEYAIKEMNSTINSISSQISSAEQEIINAENQISSAKKKLNSYRKELADAKVQMDEKLSDAQNKIDDAQNEINDLEKPKWYVLDLYSNIGFNQYKSDSERIGNVAKAFPLVFFVVAILICLTTMTRMVEEERGEIGTLKSLGYNDSSIMFKYLLYALTATLIGSIIGVFIGFKIIPTVIFNMYSMMYSLGDLIVSFNMKYALIGTLIALVCILFATYYAIRKSLKEVPADLMRPKSPSAGKRVLLEKIKFIWNKLSFTRKVTIRNVFRYKKKFLMTIIGIAGCTGLIIAGFGLQDCITNMVPNQYEKIFKYQVEVTFNDDSSIEQITTDSQSIAKLEGVTDTLLIRKETVNLNNYDTDQTITLIVPYGDISNFISLQDRKTKEKYSLNDKVIVSEKLTNLLDLKENDTLSISCDKDYEAQVGNITENYLMHYIYMNKDIYGITNYNTLLLLTDDMNSKEEIEFSNILKEYDSVSSLTFLSSTRSVFDSTMDNFKSVAAVLIVSAGLLAFVVLYNLASVNISERKRELASIKVLGFYDYEVFNYINRENTILTIIGLLCGMGIGKILTGYIIKTCEIDITMFDPIISWDSYLYAVGITLIFTLLVDIATYFSLKKIKMVESLKSIE